MLDDLGGDPLAQHEDSGPQQITEQPEAGPTLQELLVRHKQVEYQRESFETCDVELCRDQDGNWTKWVLERATEEQLRDLAEMRRRLAEQDEPLDHLTDNCLLRFLNGYAWRFEPCLEGLINAEKLRTEFDCHFLREEMFANVVAKRVSAIQFSISLGFLMDIFPSVLRGTS